MQLRPRLAPRVLVVKASRAVLDVVDEGGKSERLTSPLFPHQPAVGTAESGCRRPRAFYHSRNP